jgi:hypothetical protein
MKAVTLSTIETVFYVGSVQRVTEFVQGSYESVVSWRSESRIIFSSEDPE